MLFIEGASVHRTRPSRVVVGPVTDRDLREYHALVFGACVGVGRLEWRARVHACLAVARRFFPPGACGLSVDELCESLCQLDPAVDREVLWFQLELARRY